MPFLWAAKAVTVLEATGRSLRMFFKKWRRERKQLKNQAQNQTLPQKQSQNLRHKELAGHAIKKLNEGDSTYLFQVYSVFAFNNDLLIKQSGMAIGSLLKSYTMTQMIRLNQLFRQNTSIEWFIDWQYVDLKHIKNQFDSESDYIYALILGTFHPNGYFRERCICNLAGFKDTLPYLVLRMNDWVKSVRLQAWSLVSVTLENCLLTEIFLATQALEIVRRSERRENEYLFDAEIIIEKRIERDLKTISINDILSYEFQVRAGIFRILFSKKILPIETAEYLLKNEKHSFCQMIIITGILKYYECALSQIDEYLRYDSTIIRRKALEYKYEVVRDTWLGLEEMLLDKNYGIRQFVSFILNKYSQCSIPEFYINHLDMENPMAAILGLGESGNKNMSECLQPFLEAEDERIVRSAVIAIGKLQGVEGDELYWSYLFYGSHTVAKACYKIICSHGICYGSKWLYEAYCESTVWYERRYLLLLLLRSRTWDRLPYLMYLYGEGSTEMMPEQILAGMCGRNLCAYITIEQKELIKDALIAYEKILPEKLVAGIRFDFQFLAVQR